MILNMNTILKRLIFSTILILPYFAHAEAKVGDKFGDWVFECTALAQGKTACALTQGVATQNNSRPIIKLNLAHNDKKGANILSVIVPLGLYLPSGMSGNIDQAKPFAFTLQTCIQQGCIASYVVESNLLKALQNGQKITINFSVNGGNQAINLVGSLNGLADGLKAANIK